MSTSYFQVESELSELPSEERFEYLKSLGVNESGLGNLIRATYNLLGLRTYFTSGEKVRFWNYFSICVTMVILIEILFVGPLQETKAWTILAGMLQFC